MGYSNVVLSIWVPCLVRAELSARLPTSYSMVPISVATQEIHHGTYEVSHIVGHDAPKLHKANEVSLLLEGFFFYTEHLEEIVLDFWMF